MNSMTTMILLLENSMQELFLRHLHPNLFSMMTLSLPLCSNLSSFMVRLISAKMLPLPHLLLLLP